MSSNNFKAIGANNSGSAGFHQNRARRSKQMELNEYNKNVSRKRGLRPTQHKNDENFDFPEEKEILGINHVLKSMVTDKEEKFLNIKQQDKFDLVASKRVAKNSYYEMIHNPKIPIKVRMPYLRESVTSIHVNNEDQAEFFKGVTDKKIIINKEFSGHPHLMLNQIRRDFETDVTINEFPLRVYDTGAGARSMKWGLTHVFNNQPILSSADRFREVARKRIALENNMEAYRCQCELPDCKHFDKMMEDDKTKFDIIMAIDTTYYIGVLDFILDKVEKYDIVGFIAVHVFDMDHFKEDEGELVIDDIEICGVKEGTVTTKEIEGVTYIQMKVKGNQCSYMHKPFRYNKEAFNKNFFSKDGFAFVVTKRYVLSEYHHVVMIKCCSEKEDYGVEANNNLSLSLNTRLKQEKEKFEELEVVEEQPNYVKVPKDQLIEKYDEEQLVSGKWLVVKDEAQKRNRYYKLYQGKICEMYAIQHTDNGIIVNKKDGEEIKGIIELAVLNKMIKFILNQQRVTFDTIKTLIMQYLSKNDASYESVLALVTCALEQALEYEKKIKELYATRIVKDINDYKNGKAQIINVEECLTLRQRVTNIFSMLSLERRLFYNNRVLPFLAFLVTLFFLTGFYITIAAKVYYVVMLIRALLTDSFSKTILTICYYFRKSIFMYLFKVFCRAWGINIPFVSAMDGTTTVVSQVTIPGAYIFLKLFKQPINWLIKQITRPFQQIRIPSSCINLGNLKEVILPLSKNVKRWNIQNPFTKEIINSELSSDEFMDLQRLCPYNDYERKPDDYEGDGCKMASVVPIFKDCEEPICYHICPANNYCAIKRQCTAVIDPSDDMLDEFKEWFDSVILPEIEMFLSGFKYSVEDWYNHLTTGKQNEIKDYIQLINDSQGDMELLKILAKQRKLTLSNEFDMFVKSEKQLKENGANPKNRCIAGAKPMHKVVLGPVTWSLESYFKHNFPGYCGGKNWEQMESMINDWHKNGFNHSLQLDGSGFDRTQHIKLKEIVDFQIYKLIEDRIYHVPKELYQQFAYSRVRRINVKMYHKGQELNCGFVDIEGTVLSGAMDTTLMNTIRMALYNRFTNEKKAGLVYGLDYECIAKGDDTVAVYQDWVSKQQVQECYDMVFFAKSKAKESEWGEIKHGLGQIAKFYHWGPLSDIDFCSVSVFYIPHYDTYRMTRKLDRFLTLTGYSTKCLGKIGGLMHTLYCEALFIANNKWLENLPIFRAYNYLFRKQLPKLADNVKPSIRKIYDAVATLEFDAFAKIDMTGLLESDFQYKLYNNVESPRNNDFYVVEAFYDDLLYRYNIDRNEAMQLEKDIIHYHEDGYIYSSVVDKIINHPQHYRSWQEYEASWI